MVNKLLNIPVKYLKIKQEEENFLLFLCPYKNFFDDADRLHN